MFSIQFLETNLVGILPKASSADKETILPNETVMIEADPAERKR